jgi:geranyl-CoA carboxylase alpha subunit
VQRRQQKVIEEAPSPAVDDVLRQKMGAMATAVAQLINYVGAGTVEFLLAEDGRFYFMEMNTRLQVEHPVTEMITGLDLVAWQLRIAAGEPLPLTQAEVVRRGHAIEARLYAEDPDHNFLPSTGKVWLWQPPSGSDSHLRVDHGLHEGQEITPFYDAMVAKVIAWGETRAEARRHLVRGVGDTAVLGLITNQSFLLAALSHPAFVAGEVTTSFVDDYFKDRGDNHFSNDCHLAALLFYRRSAARYPAALRYWHSGGTAVASFQFGEDVVSVRPQSQTVFVVTLADERVTIEVIEEQAHLLRFRRDGVQLTARFVFTDEAVLWLDVNGRVASFRDSLLAPRQAKDAGGNGRVTAPMPGVIKTVLVQAGEVVAKGDPLLVLEAMKMEHRIVATAAGTAVNVAVKLGQQVAAGDLLVEITVEEVISNQ